MITTKDLLDSLGNDKQILVSKLNEKGIEASNDETFTTLCPKVGDIKQGGDISEYFLGSLVSNSSKFYPWQGVATSIPNGTYDLTATTINNSFFGCSIKKLTITISKITFAQYFSSTFSNIKDLEFLDLQQCRSNLIKSLENINIPTLKELYLPTNIGGQFASGESIEINLCPLTRESLIDIFNKLSVVSDLSLIIGPENIKKCSPEEIAIATNKGWIVS